MKPRGSMKEGMVERMEMGRQEHDRMHHKICHKGRMHVIINEAHKG